MTQIASPSQSRLHGVDAARGMAMFFSCLAHFGAWIELTHPMVSGVLTDVGKIATPTFLLLSGAMTGWLCAESDRTSLHTRYKLLNRALFLLTFGHVLISLAVAHRANGLLHTIGNATIIDDIGASMLVGVLIFPHLQERHFRQRLMRYGAVGFLLCWIAVLSWHPTGDAILAVRQALLGSDPLGAHVHSYSSPSLQYACLFSIGIGASDYLVAAARGEVREHYVRRILLIGVTMFSLALVLRGLRWLMDHHSIWVTGRAAVELTLTVTAKLPPSPAYVLFFGGMGIILCCLLFRIAQSRRAWCQRLASLLAVVGRASLFVFVLQYFIYWTLPDLVGVAPTNRFLPLIFLTGLALNWFAAWGWNRLGGNRLLTVGIRTPQHEDKDEAGAPLKHRTSRTASP